jgi:hypothetical protein
VAGAVVKFKLDEWQAMLGDVSFERAAKRGLVSGAAAAIPILHQATENAPPASPKGTKGAFNTGAYRRAWKSEPSERGARIFNAEPYAPIIESGRRPGEKPPPTEAIAQWAARRLGMSPQDSKAAAFAMARSIGARGLKARKVLGDSLEDIKAMVLHEVMFEIQRELGG